MPRKSKTSTETSQEIIKVDGQERLIDRNNLGRFAKGVSGNPKGRPKGSKSRTLIIKQAMEEALTRNAAENFNEIVSQAIEMAKAGDKDMIKFVLGDVLREVRRADADEEESKKVGKIEITFSPFQGSTARAERIIDGEFSQIQGHSDPQDPPS